MSRQSARWPRRPWSANDRVTMWIVSIVVGLVTLADTAPAPFLLDAMAGDRAVWHMPRGEASNRVSHLRRWAESDDDAGPAGRAPRERVHATFFVIDRHLTEETAPIIRGCSLKDMRSPSIRRSNARCSKSPSELARYLDGGRRPHRGLGGLATVPSLPPARWLAESTMFAGLRASGLPPGRLGLDVVGLSIGAVAAQRDRAVRRILSRAGAGGIVVSARAESRSAPREDPAPDGRQAGRAVRSLSCGRGGSIFGTVFLSERRLRPATLAKR